jgi:hypothetical protein
MPAFQIKIGIITGEYLKVIKRVETQIDGISPDFPVRNYQAFPGIGYTAVDGIAVRRIVII